MVTTEVWVGARIRLEVSLGWRRSRETSGSTKAVVIVRQGPDSATEGGMTDSPDQVCHASIHCPLQRRHPPPTTIATHHWPQQLLRIIGRGSPAQRCHA